MTQAEEVEQLVRLKGIEACSKQRVYTEAYRPFILGGDVRRPIAALVDAVGPFDIGHKYKAYIVYSPNNKTYIAELTTGAFIGPDLKTVRADVAQGDPKEMQDQLRASKDRSEYAELLKVDEFWGLFK